MKKRLVNGDSSPSLQNKKDSQLLSLPLPSSSSSVAPVASNNADNDSNPSSSGGDRSNTTRHSKTKKRSR